jgi:pyruvate formate lyase activating enzyme
MGKSKKCFEIRKQEFNRFVHDRVSCICFFGGDPSVQLDKIIEYCKDVEGKNKILRFCLETNGNFNQKLLKEFAEISLRSGGGIKFDLKFWNPDLNKAVTGIENQNSYECFKMLGKMHRERVKVAFLRASTLLIPGYITPEEVESIAKFISEISSTIPYSLLAFSPRFEMKSLASTSRKIALECKKRASKYLEKVNIGNRWLLI